LSLIHLRIYIIPTNEETATSDFVGFYFMEIWKTIKDYPDYQVSNLGRVKSFKKNKELIMSPQKNVYGYLTIRLSLNGKTKTKLVHKLVSIAFLNHKPDGLKLVVNHKNFIRNDNRVENLEIITQRENSNKKHLFSSSQYVGVCWSKLHKKWRARITEKRKLLHLGYFKTEMEAYIAYQEKLKTIKI